MAKKIVRYLLEGNGSVPLFVENGGYFPVGAELVGLSVDEDQRHIPSTVARMSRADLEARLAGMDMRDRDGNARDSDEKEAILEEWLAMVGMSDLA